MSEYIAWCRHLVSPPSACTLCPLEARIAELTDRLAKYERALDRVREVDSLPAVAWRVALKAIMHDLEAALKGNP